MSDHDSIKAQQQLEKAVDFARDVKVNPGDFFHKRIDVLVEDEEGKAVNLGKEVIKQGNIRFGEHNVETQVRLYSAKGSTTKKTDSSVVQKSAQGMYRTKIHSSVDDGSHRLETMASVRRNNTTHNFNEEHADRAAALITSLAAKRLGATATQHVDKVMEDMTAARDAFHSGQN